MLKIILSIFILLGILGCKESLTPPEIEARKKIEKKLYIRDNSKQIVLDSKKDLMWQDNTDAKNKKMTFSKAKEYCSSLELANYNDWRLPQITELVSVTTPYDKDVKIVPAFQNTKASIYWSSKVIQKRDPFVYLLNYSNARPYEEQLSTFANYNVRCVRDESSLALKSDIKIIKKSSYSNDIETLLLKTAQAPIDKTKWLFVIGIEEYDDIDNIAYSNRSAKMFTQTAQKTLGIDARRSYILIDKDATSGKIKDRLQLLVNEVKKGDTIYFYYNGHGVPDPANSAEPYILPKDKIPDFITKESDFALKNIYLKLSNSKADKVVAFIDSCFSGSTDGISLIKGVAAPRIRAKEVTFNKEKMVVLSAGRDTQYSNMYEEKGHRMFSYFLMKSMLNGRKDINKLYGEVSLNVSDTSNELGPLKKQEPTISGNIYLSL